MTMRERTASGVSIFTRQDASSVNHATQRQHQVQGALKSLGVFMDNERKAESAELSAKTRAQTEGEAMKIEAEVRPTIEAQMRDPALYKQSPEEFLKSTAYRTGADALEAGVTAPEHRKEILKKYKEGMLRQFTKGQVHHQYLDKENTHSLAQQSGAERRNIELQMRAYDNSITDGISRDDAFTAGLASAILAGPAYLKKFAAARNWTPEEDLKIAKQIKAQKSEFNMKAAVAYKLAGAEQDRTKRLGMLTGVMNQYGESLSNSQKATIIADTTILREEVAVEGWIRQNFGRVSTADMANGVGYEGRKLPIGDIKRIQNEEFHNAINTGNPLRLAQLLSQPGDEPTAAKEYFGQIMGSLAHADPDDLAPVEAAMKHGRFVEEALNPARLKSVLGAEQHAVYQEFKASAEYNGLKGAVDQHKVVQDLRAKGRVPDPEKWAKTRSGVVDHAMTTLTSSWYNPADWFSPGVDSMNRASMESQLAPHFEQWKALQLTEGQMKNRVDKIMEESSWNGYMNGGVLGDSLKNLTIGNSGNPYGDRTETDLWNSYKELKLKELQTVNEDYTGLQFIIGNDPSKVHIVDESGIPVPNGLTSAKEITQFIRENVKTTKQEVKDAAGYSPEYSIEDVHP